MLLDAIYLTLLTQCSLFDIFYSTLLLLLLLFVQCCYCSCYFLLDAPCSMLLFLLLLFVWCYCISCYSLFDAVALLTTPCSMLLLLLLFFVWHCYFSLFAWHCGSFGHSSLMWFIQILFCYAVLLLFCSLFFLLDVATPILPILDWFPFWFFCRCGRSYPNSSF